MKSKKTIYPEYPDVPLAVESRSGCKVSWETHATHEAAVKVSKYASELAFIKMDQGFDFGYCAPGSIEKVSNGYQVCLP